MFVKKVICTYFGKGKSHDFKIFKKSHVYCNHETKILADSGYQGIAKIHPNSVIPKNELKIKN